VAKRVDHLVRLLGQVQHDSMSRGCVGEVTHADGWRLDEALAVWSLFPNEPRHDPFNRIALLMQAVKPFDAFGQALA